MLKNNNQTAINRIYHRMLKQNRVRNVIVILAIVLTTFMFTAVFTLGFSMARNINQMQLRLQGTKASITIEHPTEDQVKEIGQCPSLWAAGIQIDARRVASEDGEYQYLLQYYDATEFEKNLQPAITDLQGTYPKNEKDIMLTKQTLDNLGIQTPQIGQDIVFMLDGKEQLFQLSGWYTCYSKGNTTLVSKAYMDKSGFTMRENGRVSISAKEGKQESLRDELEEQVTLRKDQKIDASYDTQSENGSNRVVIAIGIGLIAIMIVLSGYLLIYNVMYISVTKDIRFYGMLKTIGATMPQIQQIVKRQARYLACIGIPIGVVLGTGVSFGVVPLAMTMFSVGQESAVSSTISFHPGIYLFSVLFAFVTVSISARKPAKYAGRISAIDAMKYTGNEVRNCYKTTSGGKLPKMAWRNVFREKKRSILVFASVFMGSVTFLCVNTFIDCLSADSYIAHYLHNDYVLYGSGDEDRADPGVTMEDIAEKMRQIDGMDEVYTNRSADVMLPFDEKLYAPFLEEQENPAELATFYETTKEKEAQYAAPLISINTEMVELYNKTATQKVDIEAFKKGEICLIGYLNSAEAAKQMHGKTITLRNDETGNERKITVGAALQDYKGITAGYYWVLGGAPDAIFVSDQVMDSLFPDAEVDCIIANAKKGKEPEVTPSVERIVKGNSIISASDIRSVKAAEFKKSMMSLEVIGGGISLILILIGVVNYINVMITGVYTRKMELAVLESVGMTKGQIRKMLMYEGLVYGMISCGLILTLGSLMMYGTGRLCMHIADYAIFHYPFELVIVMAVVLFVICIVVPAFVFRLINKETVVERLRMAE